MKIAIVEDDAKSAKLLRDFIVRYQKARDTVFVIKEFATGLDLVSNYTADYDIVFMDIMMPFMDGMETAKALRELDNTVALIFVTNMAQMAVKGYEVNALDFLIKPVTYFDFALKMDKAISRMTKREQHFLYAKTAVGLAKIALSDIYFVEVSGRYVTLHTTNGEVELHRSMKSVENELSAYKFIRCDNSYLVNLAYVTRIDKNSAFVAGIEIPVSRAKRKKFLDALTIYLGKNING